MWKKGSSINRSNHRKAIKRRYYHETAHSPVSSRNIVLNLDNIAHRKLTKMEMVVEGRPCQVLLDSCSSTNIVSEKLLLNYLKVNQSEIYGPIGCIKGVGKAITYDLGRIQLTVKVLDKDYQEEFVVIKEPGIPGEVLLSAEAMGRCGITIDFRKRKVLLEDCNREVTFCLGELRYPVNRAHLQETNASKQRTNTCRFSNVYQIQRSSALEVNKNKRLINNAQENKKMVPCSTESHQQHVDRKTDPDNSNSSQKNNKQLNNGQNNLITKIENEIKKAQVEESYEIDYGTQDVQCDVADESYVINAMNTNKELSEVLYLGNFDKINFAEKEDSKIERPDLQREYVFMAQTENKELHCVSTNEDDKVKLKLARDVWLKPHEFVKVKLMTVNDDKRIDNKEIILTSDRHLPDGVMMDDNLNVLNGQLCESFVYNNTDKRLNLNAGRVVCSGIILNTPTLEVKSEAFTTLVSVDADKLEQEIGQIQISQGKGDLIKLLKEYRNVLAIEGDKLGRTDVVKHKIVLEENAQPFFIPNYRLPISQREKVEVMINDMKKDGIVRQSNSPYNSPLLLVPKKDGSWRLVIDYRRLNKQTVPDRFPMPVINEVLSQLGGATIFSSLDLMSGYWQLPLTEESKPLTAFSSHCEHLEFNVLPFGLTNAPLAFMRTMLQVLGNIKNVLIYIDDIIIFSDNLESHFKTLREVLERLKRAGLKLKVKKCQFLSRELEYLGHKLNEEGLKMQEGKVKAIDEYPAPSSVKSLRRFIGMIGYYRPFIQNFATIAYPLTNLLKQENNFEWGDDQQKVI